MSCSPTPPTRRYFELGTLAGETNARLRSRCRDLGIRRFSTMNRAQMKAAILDEMYGPEEEEPSP